MRIYTMLGLRRSQTTPNPPSVDRWYGCSSQGRPILAKRFWRGQIQVSHEGGFGVFWQQCVGLSMLMWIEGSNVAVGWAKRELWACLSVTFSLSWASPPAVEKRFISTSRKYPGPAGWNKKIFDLSTCPFYNKIWLSVDATKVQVLYFSR